MHFYTELSTVQPSIVAGRNSHTAFNFTGQTQQLRVQRTGIQQHSGIESTAQYTLLNSAT